MGLGAEEDGHGIEEIKGMDLGAGPVFLFCEIGEDGGCRFFEGCPEIGVGLLGELCYDIKGIEDKHRIMEGGRTGEFLGK